jgi:hypothetical protein
MDLNYLEGVSLAQAILSGMWDQRKCSDNRLALAFVAAWSD